MKNTKYFKKEQEGWTEILAKTDGVVRCLYDTDCFKRGRSCNGCALSIDREIEVLDLDHYEEITEEEAFLEMI